MINPMTPNAADSVSISRSRSVVLSTIDDRVVVLRTMMFSSVADSAAVACRATDPSVPGRMRSMIELIRSGACANGTQIIGAVTVSRRSLYFALRTTPTIVTGRSRSPG